MHRFHALGALDVCPALLHFYLDVAPETLAAEQVVAVPHQGEAVDRDGQQAQGALPHLAEEVGQKKQSYQHQICLWDRLARSPLFRLVPPW